MHIPVFLGGFLLKPQYAFLVGLITPILRSLIFTMPPLYPIGLMMSVELATYGILVSILYRVIKSKYTLVNITLTLLLSMIGGRIVWGITAYLFFTVLGRPEFSFSIFLSSAFVIALPGIVLQFVLIPPVVFRLSKISYLDITRA